MAKKTPAQILTILGIADHKLSSEEQQRFLKACSQVVEVKPATSMRKGKTKGNVVYLIPRKPKV